MTGTAPARPAAPLLLLALLAAGALGYAAQDPPRPLPASAPDSVFSAERAMVHVRAMATRPHPMGTAAHDSVRDYVLGALRAIGLEPEVQRTTAIGTRFAQAGRVENIVARLRGTERTMPAVLLVAHYDGVGGSLAASDDASGTAVVLETLRALRAGAPLPHDVIALIADGEEAGLLGAAAFVREHPWAGDVEVILNFEARGTGGRATMFQTGPDNLDPIRALRRASDVSATSVAVSVYRFLPNDTDLSELLALRKPGLNFAFADGVERYHTSQDDANHLDPGAMQQEGAQALLVARGGTLPRPGVGDAVFFDLPLVGLVYYPERWTKPLAFLALALTLWAFAAVARRDRRWWLGLILGLAGVLLTAGMAVGLTWLAARGAPEALNGRGTRGFHALGIAVGTVGLAIGWWALARRWASASSLGLPGLLLWTTPAVVAGWLLPGVSFVPLWPAVAVAVATAIGIPTEPSWRSQLVRRLPAAVALFLLAPLLHGLGLVALGVVQGGLAIAAVVALAAWLLVEDLELLAGQHRWQVALGALLAGVALMAWARRAAGRDAEFPVRSLVAYAEAADDSTAWLMVPEAFADSGSWNRSALGEGLVRVSPDSGEVERGSPQWLTRLLGREMTVLAAPVSRLGLSLPEVLLVSDSSTASGRVLGCLVRGGAGATAVTVRVDSAEVLAASVDGRVVDRSQYRIPTPEWSINYSAPPDSGFRLDLTVADGALPTLELVAYRFGLGEVAIPPRPSQVVTSHYGDLRVVYRRVSLGSVSP